MRNRGIACDARICLKCAEKHYCPRILEAGCVNKVPTKLQ